MLLYVVKFTAQRAGSVAPVKKPLVYAIRARSEDEALTLGIDMAEDEGYHVYYGFAKPFVSLNAAIIAAPKEKTDVNDPRLYAA